MCAARESEASINKKQVDSLSFKKAHPRIFDILLLN